MNTLLRKSTIGIVLLIGALACSERRNSFALPDDTIIHLTYWPAPNPQEVELAGLIVNEWNRTHPGIQVRMQPIPVSQSTEEVLLAAIAGGTTPDICSNIWPGALHEYTRAGGLLRLDQFPDFDSIASARTPRDLLKTFLSDDGHYYQMPWKTNPVMMFYNVRMFEEVGVNEVPRTYSEFLTAAKKLTRDLDGDGQIDIWAGERDIRPVWRERLSDFFPFYIAATGGRTLFEVGEPAFDNGAARDVFKFFQSCYTHEFFPRTFFQGGDPFILERKATHFAGPWQIATMQKLAPHVKYGVAPIPVPDSSAGPVYTYGDYKNIAIFSSTKHPREAWEFLKFLVTSKHDLLLLEIANQIPVRGDLTSNPLFADFFERNPKMVTFAKQTVYTRGVDAVPDLKEIFDAISQEYEACAVYGRSSPEDAVRQAVRRAGLIVDWNR